MSRSPGCEPNDDENGNLATVTVFELLIQTTKIVGYFIMSIGGLEDAGFSPNVEITALDPELYPVPDCLTNLNSLPLPTSGHFGALDYSRKSVLNDKQTTLCTLYCNTYQYILLSLTSAIPK